MSIYICKKGRNAVLSEMEQEGKDALQAGRPPGRPRPGSRPGVSGGWPAPRPAQAGLQAGHLWWVAGPQPGPGRASLVGGRPPGRPRPGSRPGGSAGWPPPRPGSLRARNLPNGLILGRGIYTPPPTSRQVPRLEQEHHRCCKSSNHIDLPIPPPKLVDLWRIEGEGIDLLFHQTISSLSEGNIFDLDLGVALCFSFVLPPNSLHSISCFGWISERRT